MPYGTEGRTAGIGLALSGGGFRATLFHLGALSRLNELGLLAKLSRVSSVSGGSIAAGVLATRWAKLRFANGVATNFAAEVAAPLRAFCGEDIDVPAVLKGALTPGKSAGDYLTRAYAKHLGLGGSLQTLPDTPRFVFNATNFSTGNSFRFSKPYAGDYRLGLIRNPAFSIAQAVTASSAFPPVFSPVELDAKPGDWERVPGADLGDQDGYLTDLQLGDGGIYDNLGLETVWNRYDTVLVSDGGAPFELKDELAALWPSQLKRVYEITSRQALALRKRQLVAAFIRNERSGGYWGIGTPQAEYATSGPFVVTAAETARLADMRTRLNKFSGSEQKALIDWGYVICDAAVRTHLLPGAAAPVGLPG